MRQPRIGGAHRRHQRVDHLGLDAVGQVPRIRDVGEAAPAVGNLLVLGERVGDVRELADVLLERHRHRLRSGLALLLARILQQIERRLDRQRLGADLEAQPRDGLVEQPVPGRIGGHRFLVEELLDAILELIGLVLADVLEPRAVVAELGIGHRRFELGVVEAVELQHEEQQMRRCAGEALLHVAVEFGAHGIDRVLRVDQSGIGGEPAEQIVELLVALDRFGNLLPASGPSASAASLPLKSSSKAML